MRHAWFLLLLLGSAAMAQTEGSQSEPTREERTVFVPYSQLDGVLGPEGRAVVVPYEQFLELWQALSQASHGEQEDPPPVDAAVSAARYDARVEGSLATFRGRYGVTVLTDRYARLALPFSGIAVSRASLDGKPALMTASDTGLELLVRGRGEHSLEIDFSAPVRIEAASSVLRIGVPPVAVAALGLNLPMTSLQLESAQGGPDSVREEGGSTIAELALGGQSNLEVSWRPRVATVLEEKSAIFVTSTQILTVSPSAIHSSSTFDFQVTQSPANALALVLPEGFTPLDVTVPGLRRQSLDGRVLRLELETPVQGPLQVVLEGEQPVDEPGAGRPVKAPLVRAQGVEREQTYVAVLEPEGLKLSATADGLAEMDPSELPQPPADGRVLQSFVYTAYPSRESSSAPSRKLNLAIERLEAEVQTDATTLLTVWDDRIAVQISVTHELRRTGLFSLRYRIPAGLRVDEVGPEDLVRSFRVHPVDASAGKSSGVPAVKPDPNTAEPEQFLDVELSGRAEEDLELQITGSMDRGAERATLTIPKLQTVGAVRERGVVGVAVSSSFEPRMNASDGLYPMDVREFESDAFEEDEEHPIAVAYRYSALPYSGELVIARKEPKVSAEVVHRVTVTEDQLKVDSIVNYSILYAGISDLTIEVPTEAGEFVDLSGPDIKEKSREKVASKGFSRWHVVLQRSVLGSYALNVRFDQSMKEIPVGTAQMFPVPTIKVLNVARDQGTIAIGKRPNLEVEPIPTDLEPLDPKELPDAARGQDVFLAYRYLKPYALNLKVLRHEYEAVLTTIANRMHLETVLFKDGLVRTEMLLEMQNNQRQYLELRLPGGSKSEGSRILSLFVAGKAVRPARKEDGTTMVRMIQSAASDQAFYIRMVYETQLGEFGSFPHGHGLQAPELLDVPVSRTTWRVYLPFGFKHTAFGGNVEPTEPWTQGWANAMAMLTQDVHTPNLGMDRGYYEPRQVRLESNRPDVPDKEGGTAGVLPIDVKLSAEGQTLGFSKLGGAARLEFTSMANGLYYGLHFALLCLVILACVVAPSRLHPAFRVSLGKAAMICMIAPIVLSPFTPASLRDALDMVFAGGLVTALAALVLGLLRRGRQGGAALANAWSGMRGRFTRQSKRDGWQHLDDAPAADQGPTGSGGSAESASGTEPQVKP